MFLLICDKWYDMISEDEPPRGTLPRRRTFFFGGRAAAYGMGEAVM